MDSRNSAFVLRINSHDRKLPIKSLATYFLSEENLTAQSRNEMLRSLVRRIQKRLSLFVPPRRPAFSYFSEAAADYVIREGYFVVHAIKGEETKRFIVGLDYLNVPAFLRLLDQAREEYGFRQQGVLVLPCLPQELQRILDAPKRRVGNQR
ncbi:hypothetical protein VNO78_20893 [Psophocarpus tetragonolobus]|uniref:Small auxin up regulated protein n=1 Tax=Psophocarpus tetragonolobus TaxID=3891 RepID=A0AAN9XHK9_PSOTE